MREFTERQKKFIQFFDGNGTEAARKAGYNGKGNSLGVMAHELLRNPKIREAIDKRNAKIPTTKLHIATREERQAFWTKVLHDQNEEMNSRLKASELLGKSEADFTEKVDHGGNVSVNLIDAIKQSRIARQLEGKGE